MSGGSYDYAFARVEEFASSLNVTSPGCADYVDVGLRKLLREHLRKVAKAMQAIEWNDSCDGDSMEREYIRDVLRGVDGKAITDMLELELQNVEDAVRVARALIKGAT